VIIGNGGGEFGVRGYVTAYDAETGDQDWRFYTVPGDPSKPVENGIHKSTKETWTGEYWKVGGGGTVWDSMAYDADLNLLYIGVGNGSPWNPAARSPEGGDNLFLSSIVALNPDTGKYVWHFQTTPGDQWDFTATQHMILADLEIDGAERKVLMQAPKNGFFYVLDRVTVELKDKTVNLGVDLAAIGLPDDQETRTSIRKSLKGRLVAWDPKTQKEAWRVDHGGPWNGGTLSTSGNLVFQGNRNQEFAAYHAKTGDKVWSTDVQTGVVAAPMTFEMDGEQYVALVAGWGGVLPLLLGELAHTDEGKVPNRSRVLMYKLNGGTELPLAENFAPVIDPPRQFATAEDIDSGRVIYARYCSGCHGDTAVAGGPVPDIRATYALHDADDWNEIILEGALEERGMVSFKDALSEGDVQNIRAYVIDRAEKSKSK